MSGPHVVLLYVSNPLTAADFFSDLLGKPPVEASPGFAMFALDSGVMLGLWERGGVEPAATPPGGAELAFTADDRATVDGRHVDWRAKGIPIIQAPTQMDFGYTFTALGPDGHRLRVFAPGGAQ